MIALKMAALAFLIPFYVILTFAVFNGMRNRQLHEEWGVTLAIAAIMIITGMGAGCIFESLF